MLVALALTIFMMSILSEAFVVGLEAFRRMKTVSDMDQQLRSAATLLLSDLKANHFEGSQRLSTLRVIPMPAGPRLESPELGFFCYREGNPSLREGLDAHNRPSERDFDDYLDFTVRLSSNRREEFFYGRLPPNSPLDLIGYADSRHDDVNANRLYTSQWMNVIYFLYPDLNGRKTASGLQVYNLYRRTLLLVPEHFTTNPQLTDRPLPTVAGHAVGDVSTTIHTPNGQEQFNSPADIQFRERRVHQGGLQSFPGYNPLIKTSGDDRSGADLLLTGVLSLDVKVFDPTPHVNDFVDLGYAPPPPQAGLPASPFREPPPNASPCPPYVYDTWSMRNNGQFNYSPPAYRPRYNVPISALQIRIRIWHPSADERLQQAREITIIVDM
jgi:hypothetical protein